MAKISPLKTSYLYRSLRCYFLLCLRPIEIQSIIVATYLSTNSTGDTTETNKKARLDTSSQKYIERLLFNSLSKFWQDPNKKYYTNGDSSIRS